MPTYTYRCTKCGDEIEAFQAMSDPPLKRCKKCRGALRRTFHPVGIVLKGSGFHRTDYRSKSESRKVSSDKTEGKAESKTDGKTEGKAEKKDSSDKKDSSETKSASSGPSSKSGSDS